MRYLAVLLFAFSLLLTANKSVQAQQCDIVVTGTPTITPNPVAAGSSISVGYVIRNNGPANAAATETKIQIKNSSDVFVTDARFADPAVNAGANSTTQTGSVLIPSGMPAGTYKAIVILDNQSVLNQSNVSNDFTPAVNFTVVSQQCDIVVTGTPTISPNPVAAGSSISVGYVIHNNGPANAAATQTKIQIKNSANPPVLITDETFSDPAVTAGGNSTTQTGIVPIPSGIPAGTYKVIVILDNLTDLNQSNVNNDFTPAVNFTVVSQQCDIVVTGTPTISPNPVAAGSSISVGYVIHNNGPANAAATQTKIQIKNSANPPVLITDETFSDPAVTAGGNSTAQTGSVPIPAGTPAGTYRAIVILDNLTDLNQSNVNNDFTPAVDFTVAGCTYSLSPTSASLGSGAGSNSFSVTAGSSCSWTATPNQSWIQCTSTGSGNGMANYSVSANPNTSLRSGSIAVQGQTFTITQAGTGPGRLAGKKIGVDAGHGGTAGVCSGSGPNATGPTGLTEASVNLATAISLKNYLEADGATVFMTRTSDTTVCPATRYNLFINNNVDMAISVHHNAGAASTNTTMAFVYCSAPLATRGTLASNVVQRLAVATGIPVSSNPAAQCSASDLPNCTACNQNPSNPDWATGINGVAKANLYMVREPEIQGIPSILAEVSFITNPLEETKLRDPQYLDGNGWAIYAGVADYYGFTPTPRGGTPGEFELLNDSPVCDAGTPAVRLNWTTSTNATSYAIYRDGALSVNDLTGLTYNHRTGVVAGQTYSYFVRASNTAGTRDSNRISVSIPIDICQTAPILSVTPTTPPVQPSSAGTINFAVSNTGGGTMSYSSSITSGSSWLSISSGGSGGNSGTIVASYTANTTDTVRNGSIQVTAAGATGSPITIDVSQAGRIVTPLWSGPFGTDQRIEYTTGKVFIGTLGSANSTFRTQVHEVATGLRTVGLHSFVGAPSGGAGSVAIWGETSNASGLALKGWNYAPAGPAVGIWGGSASTGGTGIFGTALRSTGVTRGVWGNVVSPTGFAGYFTGGNNYLQGKVGIGTQAPADPLHVVGTITGSAKNFLIDHPSDPENMLLRHSCIESDEHKNIYDGIAKTDSRGYAVVTLPIWFCDLNKDFRYLLTVLDDSDDSWAIASISSRIQGNTFTIYTTIPDMEVSWQVTGTRKDAWSAAHPLLIVEPKTMQVAPSIPMIRTEGSLTTVQPR